MKFEESFGGEVVVLAGDFRQTLPILKLASRPQIVDVTLKKSHLWENLEVHFWTKDALFFSKLQFPYTFADSTPFGQHAVTHSGAQY